MAANWKVTPGIQLIQDNEAIVGIKFTENNALKQLVNVLLSENPPEDLPLIGTWDVSDIDDMEQLFQDRIKTEEDNRKLEGIGNWNVSKVSDMDSMFEGGISFNQDISGWIVRSVDYMGYMFNGCTSFNQDISEWNVDDVDSMSSMFYGCRSFNQDISQWNVSNVKYMDDMFHGCTSFNQDISRWNVSKVKYMNDMFHGCTSFNQNISRWNVKRVIKFARIFDHCEISWKNKPPKFYSPQEKVMAREEMIIAKHDRRKRQQMREEQSRQAKKKRMQEEVTQSIESIKENLENIEEEHLSYYPTGTDTPQLKLHFNYLSLCINTIQQYIEYLKKQLISKITGGGLFDWFSGRRPVIQNNKANTVKTQRIDPASLNRIRPNRCLTEDQYNVIHKCDTNRWYRWRYSGDCRRYKGAADDITIRCEVLNNKQFNTIKDKLYNLLDLKLCPFVQNNFQSEEASGICKRLRENLLSAQQSQTDYKSQIEDLTQINELIQPADKEQIPNNVTGTDTGTAKGTRRKRKTKRTKRTTRRKRKHGR